MKDSVYDQRLSAVVYSQAHEYILATFMSLSKELDTVRIEFDLAFSSLYTNLRKQVQFNQNMKSRLVAAPRLGEPELTRELPEVLKSF